MSENNDDHHFSVSPQPHAEETTANNNTMHKSPSPDSIPLDLIEEIMMHLPVKSLIRFKCVCKPWKTLISSSEFAKHHFRRISTMGPGSSPSPSPSPGSSRHHVILAPMPSPPPSPLLRSLTDYSLHSLVNTSSSNATTYSHRVNPFGEDLSCYVQYGLGYDHFTDTYKVVAVSSSGRHDDPESYVEVHTLGTDSWRYVPDFPNAVPENSGVFVNGTLNWLVAYWDVGMGSALNYVIASMDLRTETFQELLPPVGAAGDIVIYRSSFLGVLKGCLCLLCNGRVVCDVWVMKDYGNDESWSKLFSVPYHEHEGEVSSSAKYIKALWISDKDDEILLESSSNFVVYDHKNGTLKTTIVKRFLEVAQAYVETLISP
ncbi:hypothetical protein PIB30_058024 [Stylosanthes scabra]|uniref:F-box domain-containing protein n=1 Tax=Stylosanthes scabra TaxID=79078 RepID=A0ABU6SKM3_9FABA|nr:hypothetical protein [Stylosanthes scabra]